jgi:hypothetical protein
VSVTHLVPSAADVERAIAAVEASHPTLADVTRAIEGWRGPGR